MSASPFTLTRIKPIDWSGWQTHFLFFTGKGGVGKTTVASTVALTLVEQGKRVLLVSTDPASNLDDVFEMTPGQYPTPVPAFPTLSLLNIDPESAAAVYRERVIGPYRGHLSESTVRTMEEQLSGACTVEIAAFNEFTSLLADPELGARFDHILFDTAPTGHTLRLLSLPGAWNNFIETNTHGASCLGPLAGLQAQKEQYRATVLALADARQTTVILVSRPEGSTLREAARAGGELRALGISNQHLVLNGIFTASPQDDAIAQALFERQQAALAQFPSELQATPTVGVPLVASNLTGIAAIKQLAKTPLQAPAVMSAPTASIPLPGQSATADFKGLDDLVKTLVSDRHGVVMLMGKGGVGKTMLAATLAMALAHEGIAVHLSTTDPAAHLVQTLEQAAHINLKVSRIDPVLETRRYTQEVIAAAGELDEEDRALLEEDLRSPCTEEIAVFRAFARTIQDAQHGFVVLDTAPTGHSLLLLDAAQSYHREVQRTTGEVPEEVRTLLPRLRDPHFTRVLLVTLAESTPVDEARRLQSDLRRAEIEPFGWIVNAALSASQTQHPLLQQRAALELPHIQHVRQKLAHNMWLVPWFTRPPVGEQALLALTGNGISPLLPGHSAWSWSAGRRNGVDHYGSSSDHRRLPRGDADRATLTT